MKSSHVSGANLFYLIWRQRIWLVPVVLDHAWIHIGIHVMNSSGIFALS